jgi:cytochrome oxidase Cu insertion factor (SCO1/SenC/PrrC family)
MDEQQQPNTPAPNPDGAQQANDDKLSRNLLIAGLLIVAIALGFHLMSPKEPAANAPSATASATDSGAASMEPRAAPSIRGKDAPAVTLKDMNGKPVSLADFKGKVVLVNFWATWCQPCLLELPWFIQFQEKFGKDGFQIKILVGQPVAQLQAGDTAATARP